MNDTQTDTQSSPGLILKAAREEKNLTIEQVAHELHLRPSVVRAIEDENYSEFNSDVFLKGYFRTYCRLLNLHESRMMELLESQLLMRKKCELQQETLENKQISAHKRKRLFKKLFIIAFCIVIFIISYRSINNSTMLDESSFTNQQNDNSQTTLQDPSQLEQAADLNQVDHTNSVSAESVMLDEDSKISEKSSTLDSSIDMKSSEEVSSQKDLSSNSKDVSSLEDPDEIQTETVDPHQVSLKALFSGDCWFKVTDSRGKTLAAALKKNGHDVTLTGTAPFHLVIGDASKVTLFFEDKEVDIRPFTTRNGRAELTLTSSETELEG